MLRKLLTGLQIDRGKMESFQNEDLATSGLSPIDVSQPLG